MPLEQIPDLFRRKKYDEARSVPSVEQWSGDCAPGCFSKPSPKAAFLGVLLSNKGPKPPAWLWRVLTPVSTHLEVKVILTEAGRRYHRRGD